MFWVGSCVQDRFHELADRRSDAAAPHDQFRRRPLQVGAVRRGHVVRVGDEALSTVLAYMAGHPPAAVEELDHGCGRASLNRLVDQAMRRRVEVRVVLHVVIDVDPGGLPQRDLVACGGQGLQCVPLELLEQRPARKGLATKRTLIDQADLLSNGDVQLAEREEPTLAQRSQNPVLCDLDASFHGPLVLGPIRPGWQNSERVPAGQLLVTGVQTGLIPARFGDA
jgi:hypothetical protein